MFATLRSNMRISNTSYWIGSLKMKVHAPIIALLFSMAAATGTAYAANVPVPAEKCNAAWGMASPNGATIAKGADVPFVLDFMMVDSNKDAVITADEFNKACSSGQVKANEATVHNMK
jgi:hypothetical protein